MERTFPVFPFETSLSFEGLIRYWQRLEPEP